MSDRPSTRALRPRLATALTGLAILAGLVLPVAASAGPLNTVVLDNGICGRNLQLGSDPTASSSATPTFLLYGDGAAASYRIFIDGALLGTFNTSNPYGNVCITTTVALSQGAHTLTGNELQPARDVHGHALPVQRRYGPARRALRAGAQSQHQFGRHRRQHHDLPVPEPERHVRAECPDPGLRRPRGGRRWASRQHGPLDGHDDDALDCPHTLTATASDQAGNVSARSAALSLTIIAAAATVPGAPSLTAPRPATAASARLERARQRRQRDHRLPGLSLHEPRHRDAAHDASATSRAGPTPGSPTAPPTTTR